jgi:hypothetical protein
MTATGKNGIGVLMVLIWTKSNIRLISINKIMETSRAAAGQFSSHDLDSGAEVITQHIQVISSVATGSQKTSVPNGSSGWSQKITNVLIDNIAKWRPLDNCPMMMARITRTPICKMVILKALIDPGWGGVDGEDNQCNQY